MGNWQIIWPASLVMEAVTLGIYSWRGGFPYFRAMMFLDIMMQSIQIFHAQHHGSHWIHRISEMSCELMMILAVAEAARMISGAHYSRSLLIAAAISLAAYSTMSMEVYWSRVAAFVWSSEALSHMMMAIFLVLCMLKSRPRHSVMLAVWMLGTSVLFYLAPKYPVGIVVVWWNLVCWCWFTGIALCHTGSAAAE